jgi:organic hydroperoxide reductase OsmC/OhrA
MSAHHATIDWKLRDPDFIKGRYSREHTWNFDGGLTVAASPSPSVVPTPWSNPANIDPEEAFVASVASCHMLTFLWLAAKAGYVIERYRDEAVGTMTKNERGVPWVSLITLRPEISYGENKCPDAATEAELHHQAHEQCFIANSINTEVEIEAPSSAV